MSFMEIEEVSNCEGLPLLSLNHVSLLCRSVWASVRFYEEVLGFVLIKRPSSFNFNGAWLAFY
ncbi:Glyoxalase/fosfomycin resistance/dioxygenase domain containing protein [Parasponia andersonii]|uniref:Glyoxalase/fosfomycin resistance/dioxygenase domain containing protein n=1 Tax=Parasponia andersonii TaxID=3476 RepID=A0A2P5DLU2_PARAD|nr:Glyoxalase/fosfomycin resistance/dioxygenase domain containing protein [Parasponia andersonii]